MNSWIWIEVALGSMRGNRNRGNFLITYLYFKKIEDEWSLNSWIYAHLNFKVNFRGTKDIASQVKSIVLWCLNFKKCD